MLHDLPCHPGDSSSHQDVLFTQVIDLFHHSIACDIQKQKTHVCVLLMCKSSCHVDHPSCLQHALQNCPSVLYQFNLDRLTSALVWLCTMAQTTPRVDMPWNAVKSKGFDRESFYDL